MLESHGSRYLIYSATTLLKLEKASTDKSEKTTMIDECVLCLVTLTSDFLTTK